MDGTNGEKKFDRGLKSKVEYMKRFCAIFTFISLFSNLGEAATPTKHAKSESCEAAYIRQKQEIAAIDKDHLQRCFYDETCTQEEKCDWYITENEYFRNLSKISSACVAIQDREKEAASYSAGIVSTDKLVERCTTGDLAGAGGTPLTKEARAMRIKTALHHAREGGRAGRAVRGPAPAHFHSSKRK